MDTDRSSQRRIVGVFDDRQQAERLADELRRAGLGEVQVDAHDDMVASLEGEMREESQHTIVGPGNVGPFTKEMTKGITLSTPVFTLLGALILLPFALIPFMGLSAGMRVLICVAVGAFAGATAGFVVGGGEFAKGPRQQLAAERGVTLSITTDAERALSVAHRVEGAHPIRLDMLDGEGRPLSTVTTEEEQGRLH